MYILSHPGHGDSQRFTLRLLSFFLKMFQLPPTRLSGKGGGKKVQLPWFKPLRDSGVLTQCQEGKTETVALENQLFAELQPGISCTSKSFPKHLELNVPNQTQQFSRNASSVIKHGGGGVMIGGRFSGSLHTSAPTKQIILSHSYRTCRLRTEPTVSDSKMKCVCSAFAP